MLSSVCIPYLHRVIDIFVATATRGEAFTIV